MQFIYHYQIGAECSNVMFRNFNKLSNKPKGILIKIFFRLGAKINGEPNKWLFPPFITSEIIQTVINNTCFKCGGLMRDSYAFKNEDLVHNERIVWKDSGEAKQIKVRKCTQCGHSHT